MNNTVYTLGTTGGNQTLQVLAVANISGGPTVTAAAAAGSTVGSGGGALMTIGLGGNAYTFTLTMATLGPGVVYSW
ncbi:MAG: hypothetical protein HZB54_09875 [Deltaproteobacteria bacterium]|nr:hypothetical protein [Deltaproteobacteria bacterium]